MDALSNALTRDTFADTDNGGSTTSSEDYSRAQWKGLFRELAAGDARAFERLYDRIAKPLFGFAVWRLGSREDAADVVHDTFVRIAEQGEGLLRVRNPRSWIFSVAGRIALDRLRKQKRWRVEPLDELQLLTDGGTELGREIDAGKAQVALLELPRAQREAVFLRHFGGFTFSEIGSVLGVPMFTAASRYRLGIRKLRRLLEVSK